MRCLRERFEQANRAGLDADEDCGADRRVHAGQVNVTPRMAAAPGPDVRPNGVVRLATFWHP